MTQLGPGVVVAGRYRLTRLLGQGGMGSVWVADNIALDAPCAVKFIHGEAAQSPELRARFEREAKAAAQLRSPNVVQILDHGIFDDTPYMAMELLEGEDLSHRLKRMRQLHPREIASIVAQTGRALSKAHAAGLVHRDLKPGNIFLVRDDDREIVKVLDFGVAKVTTSGIDTGLDNNTKTGAVLGTPFYMSPEQGRGIRAVDHRADLWSLAVVTYQCLTGRLPFQSDGLGDLLIKIMMEPLPVPSQVANVPPGFDAWWMRAAAREPNDRFQSAREMSDALTIALGLSTPGSDLGASWSSLRGGAGQPAQPGQVGPPLPPATPPPSHQGHPMTPQPMRAATPYPFPQTPTPQPHAQYAPMQGQQPHYGQAPMQSMPMQPQPMQPAQAHAPLMTTPMPHAQTASPIVAPSRPTEAKKNNVLVLFGIVIALAAMLGIAIAYVATRPPASAAEKKADSTATSTPAAPMTATSIATSSPGALSTATSSAVAPSATTSAHATDTASPDATATQTAAPKDTAWPPNTGAPVTPPPQKKKKDFGI